MERGERGDMGRQNNRGRKEKIWRREKKVIWIGVRKRGYRETQEGRYEEAGQRGEGVDVDRQDKRGGKREIERWERGDVKREKEEILTRKRR